MCLLAATLRPRLVLAPCNDTIDWNSDQQLYSSQLFGLRLKNVRDPTGVRLMPVNPHPNFGTVRSVPSAG